jgi:type III secretion protein V
MTTPQNLLAALPLHQLSRRADVILAASVTLVVAMVIVPLPAPILDFLLAVNLACSLGILLSALFAKRALELSTFPTLLLVTTLFRLALNVSTTRGILAQGHAGEVVKAFGRLVLQGDIVVGAVLFLVITLVQFLVIAKGAERVAEVGARFTLDAMPGKQMSIDAAVRSGAIDETEGEKRRRELSRESQLFGNMDGAMKFVKGDAIAGLVITAINLIAGLLIGVTRRGMPIGDALDTYSVLSVGDGLVSQIPALLITLAAGLIVTRVEAAESGADLGESVRAELLGNPKVLGLGAAAFVGLALVPGLPALPFGALGLLAVIGLASGRFLKKHNAAAAQHSPGNFQAQLEARTAQAKAQKTVSDQLTPSVVPIGLDLDPVLTRALGFDDADAQHTELVETLIPQVRDALYLETGVRFPGVRVRTGVSGLPSSSFAIRLNDVPVLEESMPADRCLATARPEQLRKLGVDAEPTHSPVNGAPMALIRPEHQDAVEKSGIRVWSPAGVLALHLAAVLRRRAKSFIGLNEVGELLERLEKAYPTLVKEVVPKVVSLAQVVEVLRRLVDEGVSIRDLKSIVEALGEHGAVDQDPLFLTEKARAALSTQIAHAHAGLEARLPVLLLDPVIEETVQASITPVKGGRMLCLEPALCREILRAVALSLQPIVANGHRPIILTNGEIRRFVRKLVELELPQVAVLSFDELPADLAVQPLGRAALGTGQ